MPGHLRIFLKANERLFLNGAELRVDRKVAIELMNEVSFLLESHVLQPEDATTPMRKLYCTVQSMLIEPASAEEARATYVDAHRRLLGAIKNQDMLEGLVAARQSVDEGRIYEALKRIRALFEIESALLGSQDVLMVRT